MHDVPRRVNITHCISYEWQRTAPVTRQKRNRIKFADYLFYIYPFPIGCHYFCPRRTARPVWSLRENSGGGSAGAVDEKQVAMTTPARQDGFFRSSSNPDDIRLMHRTTPSAWVGLFFFWVFFFLSVSREWRVQTHCGIPPDVRSA